MWLVGFGCVSLDDRCVLTKVLWGSGRKSSFSAGSASETGCNWSYVLSNAMSGVWWLAVAAASNVIYYARCQKYAGQGLP